MSSPSASAPSSPALVRSPLRRLLALVSTALLAALPLSAAIALAPATPAHAAGAVTATILDRPDLVNTADPNYLTELTLAGSGFQSVQGGFGGIYVFFGWIAGNSWAPSTGGTTGDDYRYVTDDETNPVGYQLFVSFPGSSTEYAANGGVLAGDGTFSATLKIPGASFDSADRDGTVAAVNCLEVQCGIITIGAHGVKNANNETFTPITFTDVYSGAAAPSGAVDSAPVAPAPAPSETPSPSATPEPQQTTTVIAAPPAVAPGASRDEQNLMTILVWSVVGVGVLAVLTLAFLVWAVVSGRSQSRKLAMAAAGGPAAPPTQPMNFGAFPPGGPGATA